MSDKTDYRMVNKQLSAEIDYKALGHHMRDARRHCKLTQAEIAEKMKLGVKYYAALEAGTANINLLRLIQFITITHVSADSLLTGTHKDYPTGFPSHSATQANSVYTKREELHHLIDKCPDSIIDLVLILTKTLKDK